MHVCFRFRWLRAFAPLLVLASSLTGRAALPEPSLSDVAYGEHPRQVLDFYRAEAGEPTPVVVYLHGGAWVNGDKRDIGKRNFERCLEAGISLVSINYRYVRQAREAGVEPPVSWPMHDAARAVQFVRSKAEEWNLDPERIATSGTSAGACTALWIALHDDLADPDEEDPLARLSTRVSCAAVDSAQTTLDPRQMRACTPNNTYGGHAFGINGRSEEDFARFLDERERLLPWIEAYSPAAQADAGDPPIFLVYERAPDFGKPQRDATHSANFGVGLKRALDGFGVSCELAYPGSEESRHDGMESYLIDRLTKNGTSRMTAEVELPEREKFPVYLLMGQSNMAGRDRSELDRQVDDPRVLAFSAAGRWSVARDPIHEKRGRTEPGEGPGIAFGKAMAEAAPDETIGLIPCAIGGSSLDAWRKGEEHYERAVSRAREAARAGTLAGVLWHQGETDAANGRRAERYAGRLQAMFADLREDLGDPRLPIVVGEIGHFLDPEKQPHAEQIREALREVAAGDPRIELVGSDGLVDKGDSLHFDAASSRELGRRFAAAMSDLRSEGGVKVDDPDEGPVLPTRVFEQLEAGREQTVVLYGTSLTHTGAWAKSVPGYFETHYPGKVEVINAASSGKHSNWGVANLPKRVLKHHPDLVLIEFSANDAATKHGISESESRANLDRMVRELRQENPEVEVVVQTMNPAWDSSRVPKTYDSDRPKLEDYYEVSRSYALEKGLPLIDHEPAWKRIRDGEPERFRGMVLDGIHPSSTASRSVTWAGVEAMFEAARNTVRGGRTLGLPVGATEVVELWPEGRMPGKGASGPESLRPRKGDAFHRVTDISHPTLSLFPAEVDGPAPLVIVCPGGGYGYLVVEKEGSEIARWLNSLGFHAAVLKYRAPHNRGGAFQDIQRAIRVVRSRADEWKVGLVGAMGFSAGGHLVARAGSRFDDSSYEAIDGIDELSCRPDFVVPVYPAYLDDREGGLSPDLDPTADLPPTLIVHNDDDRSFIAGSKLYAEALEKQDAPFEFLCYPTGGHGYGLHCQREAKRWPADAAEWLARFR